MQLPKLFVGLCLAVSLWTASAQDLLPSQDPPPAADAITLPIASPTSEQGLLAEGELPAILSNISIFTTALTVFAEVADNVTGVYSLCMEFGMDCLAL